MTARWSFEEQPRTGDPLRPDATPAASRDVMRPDDRAAFDLAYHSARATAREELDLTDLFRCLDHWRHLALLQREPERFASIAAAPPNASSAHQPADERLASAAQLAFDGREAVKVTGMATTGSPLPRPQSSTMSRIVSPAERRSARLRAPCGRGDGFPRMMSAWSCARA